ncbi:hypothetical protein Mapa_000178 [Marchantia paleacea]|nr:hypothetical protein Mapa_000178 [Marchantia paleacea]
MLPVFRRLRLPKFVSAFSSVKPEGQVKRQSADVETTPPEPQVIVEPEQNLGDWERRDPKFAAMSQQVVGIITTRPGGKQEMGNAVVTEESTRPMPMDRHTTLLSGPDEDTVTAAGSLNLKQIREIFILYQEQGMNEESIAEKFNVDAELLKQIFRHTSLVVPDQAGEFTFKDK